jgi:hypothetical protein
MQLHFHEGVTRCFEDGDIAIISSLHIRIEVLDEVLNCPLIVVSNIQLLANQLKPISITLNSLMIALIASVIISFQLDSIIRILEVIIKFTTSFFPSQL